MPKAEITYTEGRTERVLTVPPPVKPPPSLDEVFNTASGDSAVITNELDHAADRLIDANLALDDVVLRAGSEIESLQKLRDAAIEQRRRNSAAIKCITEALQRDA